MYTINFYDSYNQIHLLSSSAQIPMSNTYVSKNDNYVTFSDNRRSQITCIYYYVTFVLILEIFLLDIYFLPA